jgi:uncharacterized protein YjeT (DUF2065 family)
MAGLIAVAVVAVAGVYLVALAVVSMLDPARAAAFLNGFARTAALHYLELCLRLVAGAALVLSAPGMLFPGAFAAAGWVLVLTTALLFLLPWRWHRRFAELAVPHATRHMRLIGAASLALGVFLLAALFAGAAGPAS